MQKCFCFFYYASQKRPTYSWNVEVNQIANSLGYNYILYHNYILYQSESGGVQAILNVSTSISVQAIIMNVHTQVQVYIYIHIL